MARLLLSICCIFPFILSFFNGTVNGISPYVGVLLAISVLLSCIGGILLVRTSNAPGVNIISFIIGTGMIGGLLLYLTFIGNQSAMLQYFIGVIPIGWLYLLLIAAFFPRQELHLKKGLFRTCVLVGIFPSIVFAFSYVCNHLYCDSFFSFIPTNLYTLIMSFPLWVLGFYLLCMDYDGKR